MQVKHIHSGGLVGGFSICGASGGTVHNDADDSNCLECIKSVRDYVIANPNSPYVDEVKRACDNVGLEFIIN